MVDKDEFFRQATLRLCGSLELDEGLRECLVYLREHLPVYALYLQRYESDLAAMRLVARATASDSEKMNVLVELPRRAVAAIEARRKRCHAGTLPLVGIVNDPENEPITAAMLVAAGEPSSSALTLALVVDGRPLGSLIALAKGPGRFTEAHAELYGLLKEPFFVALSNTLRYEEVVRLRDALAEENLALQRQLHGLDFQEIVGADFGLREVMTLARQVAQRNSPVLLLGETGVGKDIIARAIHLLSTRRDGPFVPVNCGAIPDSLIDSELFGHEKGAFTGAISAKRGRFERAQGGTIFLDEVGELPPPAQVRLLRVLQEREVERVGGAETIPIDIRVVAATNRDLAAMVEAGEFRQDLWFRLNVFPITIPPVRERPGDIPALVEFFVRRKAIELKLAKTPELAVGAIEDLVAYEWPGNVRELENLVERAMIINPDGPLHFDLAGPRRERPDGGSRSATDGPLSTLDDAMRAHIERALARADGKIHGPGGAGELLGLNPNTLRGRMAKLGISFTRKSDG